jgi:hypothetical protein
MTPVRVVVSWILLMMITVGFAIVTIHFIYMAHYSDDHLIREGLLEYYVVARVLIVSFSSGAFCAVLFALLTSPTGDSGLRVTIGLFQFLVALGTLNYLSCTKSLPPGELRKRREEKEMKNVVHQMG